jgi:hypothetical protein
VLCRPRAHIICGPTLLLDKLGEDGALCYVMEVAFSIWDLGTQATLELTITLHMQCIYQTIHTNNYTGIDNS